MEDRKKMNSTPTISHLSKKEFNGQWIAFKSAVMKTGINLPAVMEVMDAFIKVHEAGGHGKVQLSIQNDRISHVKIEGSRDTSFNLFWEERT